MIMYLTIAISHFFTNTKKPSVHSDNLRAEKIGYRISKEIIKYKD